MIQRPDRSVQSQQLILSRIMPIVLRLQSVVESQLQGIGPADIVSIVAELVVAACFFGPLVAAVAITSWILKRTAGYRAAQSYRQPLH
jgi:hypothetical protein